MADRKYGQRGYRESEKEGGGKSERPRECVRPGCFQVERSSAAPAAAHSFPRWLISLGSVPSAEQSCMPASSAPTSPQASGLSARRLFRSASPTSALATSAHSFPSAPRWSAKPRRDQGALTMRVVLSTISSRSSRSDDCRFLPDSTRSGSCSFSDPIGMRIDHLLVTAFLQHRVVWAEIDREARKGKPLPPNHAPVVIDLDRPGHPFDAGWASAESRIAARSRKQQ